MWIRWCVANKNDADLISGNIKSWEEIFGVDWSLVNWSEALWSFAFLDMYLVHYQVWQLVSNFYVTEDIWFIYFISVTTLFSISSGMISALSITAMNKNDLSMTKYNQWFWADNSWASSSDQRTNVVQKNWDILYILNYDNYWWGTPYSKKWSYITFDLSTKTFWNLWVIDSLPWIIEWLPAQWSLDVVVESWSNQYTWVAILWDVLPVTYTELTNSLIYSWNTYSTWYRWYNIQSFGTWSYSGNWHLILSEALKS
jgi:hypothetical protein